MSGMGIRPLKLREGKPEIEGFRSLSQNGKGKASSSSKWSSVCIFLFCFPKIIFLLYFKSNKVTKSYQGKSHQFEGLGKRLVENHEIKTSGLRTNSFLYGKAGNHSARNEANGHWVRERNLIVISAVLVTQQCVGD